MKKKLRLQKYPKGWYLFIYGLYGQGRENTIGSDFLSKIALACLAPILKEWVGGAIAPFSGEV